MKRTPLERRTPLLRTRTPLKARASKLRPRRRANPMTSTAFVEREAWGRDLGPCVVCPSEGRSCEGRVQGHHAVSKQTLKRHALHRFLWDLRNRVPVCEWRHEQHTNGFLPIPRDLLPASVFAFAAEVGLSWWLDKHYPSTRAAA